ncbi:hypothetical protein ES705_43702 [subsurface metagenome]
MKISINYRDDEKIKSQVVALYCEEPDLKKMVKFIKFCEKHPLCYSCDNLKVIQAFFEGSSEDIKRLVNFLKKKGYSLEGERE